jgi:radical SAM protein with 4Fe4S-binding SPASM domain
MHELIDIINLASHLKVKTIFFQYMEFVGMEDRKINLIGGMNILKLKKQFIEAAKLAARKRINSNLSVWLTDLNLYANKMKPIENFKPNNRRCYFPWFSTFIEANGDVKACPVVGWIKNEGKMGNAFEEKFVDIWNNTSYGQIRSTLKKGCRPFVPCKTCIPHKLSSIFYIFSKMLPKN